MLPFVPLENRSLPLFNFKSASVAIRRRLWQSNVHAARCVALSIPQARMTQLPWR